jgi:hypothetical protein
MFVAGAGATKAASSSADSCASGELFFFIAAPHMHVRSGLGEVWEE